MEMMSYIKSGDYIVTSLLIVITASTALSTLASGLKLVVSDDDDTSASVKVFVTTSVTNSTASGLPSPEGIPVFVAQPDDVYFVVRGRSAAFTCGASPAVQINVKCAGQWIDPSRQVTSEVIDPRSEVKYLLTNVELTKDDVESLFGSHTGGVSSSIAGGTSDNTATFDGDSEEQCECYAVNNVPVFQSVRSRKLTLRLAYLRKRFEQEPINTVAELASSVQLQCAPPVGLPTPQMFWLKDGEIIDVQSDTRHIVSNDGSLIISQVQMSDSGNYSCVAQNIAGRRISESATLSVKVSGVWTSWSEWSGCSACLRGTQRRSRTCIHPVLTGVVDHAVAVTALCLGDATQRMTCNIQCPVNGGWSPWSTWSSCGADCRQYRRRICDSPLPERGGLFCQGLDLNSTLCFDATTRCKDSVDQAGGDNIIKYVGLALGFAVFLLAVGLTTGFLLRSQHPQCEAIDNKHLADVRPGLLISNIKKTVVLMKPEYLDPPTISSRVISSEDDAITISKDDDNILQPSNWLPSDGDFSTVVWTKVIVPHGSVYLCADNLGVSLILPDGAITSSCDVFLTSLASDNNRPTLTASTFLISREVYECRKTADEHNQTLLGGVIVCGPASAHLSKPVVLSFLHCAKEAGEQWDWSVLYSDDTSDGWRFLDCSQPNSEVCLYVEPDRCHLMTSLLGSYALIGQPSVIQQSLSDESSAADNCTDLRPVNTFPAAKILRLAVFAPKVPVSLDFNLRVYFVEDTPDTIEQVLRIEKQLGGSLVDKSSTLEFRFGAGNLHLSISELGQGWRLKQVDDFQEIPFRHIWNGSHRGLHCSFALEHTATAPETDLTNPQWNRLDCTILASQIGGQSQRKILRLSHDVSYATSQVPILSRYSTSDDTINSRCRFVHIPQSMQTSRLRLTPAVRRHITEMLRRPNTYCFDWRTLTRQLGFSRHVAYFSSRPSPMDRVLDLYESVISANRSSSRGELGLIAALRVIGHSELAANIELQLRRRPVASIIL